MRLGASFLLTLGLGVALEWYQTQVPGRFGTLFDVLLNLVGTLLGLILAFFLI
jgi:VanZ family protein